MPRDLAGAISARYSGPTTVSPPAPIPLTIREKIRRPKIPDEKMIIKSPIAHVMVKSCQDRRRPNLSARLREIKAPKAAPRIPVDVILALRLARPDGLSFQFDVRRLKSCSNDFNVIEALNPPSS